MRNVKIILCLVFLMLTIPLVVSAVDTDSSENKKDSDEQHSSNKEKVIIDADMGQLNDDAVAMFMLTNANNVDVLGVTIVAGNTWMEEGTAYALRQLELIQKQNIPVIPGAGKPLMGK